MQVSWWMCVKCFEAPPTHPIHIGVLLKILHQKCFLRLSNFDLLGPIRKSLFLCNIKTKTSEFRAARFCLWKRVQNIHCFGQCSTKIWHMPFLSNMKSWEENLRFGARLHYNSINSVAKFWLSRLFSSSLLISGELFPWLHFWKTPILTRLPVSDSSAGLQLLIPPQTSLDLGRGTTTSPTVSNNSKVLDKRNQNLKTSEHTKHYFP